VRIEGDVVGAIDGGLLLLVGFRDGDVRADLEWMAKKCVELRVFRDDEGKMNRSLLDAGGGLLVVSQFTLYGDTRKGRRPSFVGSAPPDVAQALYDEFVEILRGLGVPVSTGRFGAMMDVDFVNDGPVTLILERGAATED